MPKAVWNDLVVAESDDTVLVEGNHYFPRAALRDDLHTAHARLTAQVVARGTVPGAAAQDPAGAADALVHAWERATPDVVAARATLRSVLTGTTDLAKASVGLRVVRGLVED